MPKRNSEMTSELARRIKDTGGGTAYVKRNSEMTAPQKNDTPSSIPFLREREARAYRLPEAQDKQNKDNSLRVEDPKAYVPIDYKLSNLPVRLFQKHMRFAFESETYDWIMKCPKACVGQVQGKLTDNIEMRRIFMIGYEKTQKIDTTKQVIFVTSILTDSLDPNFVMLEFGCVVGGAINGYAPLLKVKAGREVEYPLKIVPVAQPQQVRIKGMRKLKDIKVVRSLIEDSKDDDVSKRYSKIEPIQIEGKNDALSIIKEIADDYKINSIYIPTEDKDLFTLATRLSTSRTNLPSVNWDKVFSNHPTNYFEKRPERDAPFYDIMHAFLDTQKERELGLV